MCCTEGGRDLCVKLGLNTSGEEGRPLQSPRLVCVMWIVHDIGPTVSACAKACLKVVMDVFLRGGAGAWESPHPKCNRRMLRFKETSWHDTVSKARPKTNTPRSSLCLHLCFRLWLCAKRRGLEGWRKHTKLQSAPLSLTLWNAYTDLSRSAFRSQVWPRVWSTRCLLAWQCSVCSRVLMQRHITWWTCILS